MLSEIMTFTNYSMDWGWGDEASYGMWIRGQVLRRRRMHEDPIESNQMEGTVRWVEWHA
jgi:hypothetical protein